MGLRTLRDSGWTGRSLAIVILHSTLLQVLTFALRPTLTYAALEAGMGVELLGLLSAAFALPGLLVALPVGRLTDRVGERWVVVAGGVLMLGGVGIALLGRGDAWPIVAGTTLFGLGHILAVIGDQALLANRTTSARRDGIFAAYAFSISLGQAVGGGLLAIGAGGSATPDIGLQLAIATGLAVALAGIALGIRRSPEVPDEHRPPRQSIAGLLRRPHVLRAIVSSSLVVTSVEIALVYFPALGYERGFPAVVVSIMLVSRSVAAMLSRVGLGWQLRLIGRRRLMVGSIAVSAVALASFALPLDATGVLIACVVFGFSNGVCQPLTMSWLSEIAPAGQRGTLMSMRIAAVRISQTALPAGIGMLSAVVGAGGVLAGTAVLVGAAAWMAVAIGRETPPTAPEPEGPPV